eukprot:TRINITY_DN20134_c0_g1_i1.p1 TRINITY_DN20134_c0_g1~~TRINITY_DN20134_c0_g1_i1.p1  ORF type:complete len:250 (-),score=61.50 TRINITY_DN20134_c0_g1_i1:15-764(-)
MQLVNWHIQQKEYRETLWTITNCKEKIESRFYSVRMEGLKECCATLANLDGEKGLQIFALIMKKENIHRYFERYLRPFIPGAEEPKPTQEELILVLEILSGCCLLCAPFKALIMKEQSAFHIAFSLLKDEGQGELVGVGAISLMIAMVVEDEYVFKTFRKMKPVPQVVEYLSNQDRPLLVRAKCLEFLAILLMLGNEIINQEILNLLPSIKLLQYNITQPQTTLNQNLQQFIINHINNTPTPQPLPLLL